MQYQPQLVVHDMHLHVREGKRLVPVHLLDQEIRHRIFDKMWEVFDGSAAIVKEKDAKIAALEATVERLQMQLDRMEIESALKPPPVLGDLGGKLNFDLNFSDLKEINSDWPTSVFK